MTKKRGKKKELAVDWSECLEAQENEMEALKAIYDEDFIDETDAGDTKFRIRIVPFATRSDETNHCCIFLKVVYPEKYPFVLPKVKVEKDFGLSDKHLEELTEGIHSLLQEMDGEVIVYTLCEFAQEFLKEHNKKTLSFHEEMLERQRLEDEEKILQERLRKASLPARETVTEDTLKARAEDTVREAALGIIQSIKRGAPPRPRKASSECLGDRTQEEKQQQQVLAGMKKSPSHPDFTLSPRARYTTNRVAFSEPDHKRDDEKDIALPFPSMTGRLDRTGSSTTEMSSSRFHTDFEEVCVLGKGAFGEVWKVRNRLDGRFYAVKRIKLHSSDREFNARVFREVITLSRLINPNIVRYYQAWVEGVQELVVEEEEEDPEKRKQETTIVDSVRSDSVFLPSTTHTFDSSLADNVNDFMDSAEGEDLSLLLRFQSSYGGGRYGLKSSEGSSSKKPQIYYPEYLFIQMEFCDQTLRDVIQERLAVLSNPEQRAPEVDKLFRQIVEGVVEIHNQGVAHRDLKPANIFVDGSGQVKIGDFGLSRATRKSRKNRQPTMRSSLHGAYPSSSLSSDLESDDGDTFGETDDGTLTQGVGTLLYISPEQFRDPRDYNVDDDEGDTEFDPMKADIYALGIILFEMLHPLLNRSERVRSIKDVRKGVFPRGFVERYSRHASYIRTLLANNPEQRPTIREFAGLLPPSSEDAHIQDALRVIADPNSAFLSKLLSVLIQSASSKHAWTNSSLFLEQHEYGDASGVATLQEDSFVRRNHQRENIMEALESVFVQHGAEHLRMPIFEPVSWGFSDRPHAMRTIDQYGKVVYFRYDLREPFVRYLIKNRVETLRRFETGRVYRCGDGPGEPPKAFWQSDFDIVGGDSLLPDAEVLVITVECCRRCLAEVRKAAQEKQMRPYAIRISHTALLNAALDCCLVDAQHKVEAMRLISTLVGGRSWAQTRKKLISKGIIQERMLLWLEQNFLLPKELSPYQTIDRLKSSFSSATFGGSSRATAIAALNDLSALLDTAKAMDPRIVLEPLRIDLALVMESGVYNGVILQALIGAEAMGTEGAGGSPSQLALRSGSFGGGTAGGQPFSCVVIGGRYDLHLREAHRRLAELFSADPRLQRAWFESSPPQAVGISVAIDKLLMLVPRSLPSTQIPYRGQGVEDDFLPIVLVSDVGSSAEGSLLQERLETVGALWQAGVPAETVNSAEDKSPEEYEAYAIERRIRYILQVKEKPSRLGMKPKLVFKVLEWRPELSKYRSKEDRNSRADVCEYLGGLVNSVGQRRSFRS